MAATDQRFRIIFEGVEQDAIAKIQNVVKGLNTATQATKQFSRERQQLARAERQDRFRSMSAEEQYQRLLQRRETIERRLANARLRGNSSRAQALELALARNRNSISRQRAPMGAPPVIQGVGPGLLGRLGAAGAEQIAARAGGGLLGGFLRAAGVGTGIGAGIGVFMMVASAMKALATAVVDAVKSTIDYADQVSDTADTLGISSDEVIRLQQAASQSGVRDGKVYQGLASVAGMRSAALSGDARASALFDRFQISNAQLESGDSDLKIATDIAKSLGNGGITPNDFGPLKALFGKRPDQMFSALNAYVQIVKSASGDVENATNKLGRLGDFMSQAQTAFMRFKLKVMNGLVKWYEEHEEMIKDVTVGAMSGLASSLLAASKTIPLVGDKIHEFLTGLISKAVEATNEAFGTVEPPSGIRSADPSPFVPPDENAFAAPESKLGPFAAADALARIGGFRGPIDPDRVDVFKQQLNELRKIRQSQEKTATGLQMNLT